MVGRCVSHPREESVSIGNQRVLRSIPLLHFITPFPHTFGTRSLVASAWHPLGRTIVGLGWMEQSDTDPWNLLEDPSCEPRPFFPTRKGIVSIASNFERVSRRGVSRASVGGGTGVSGSVHKNLPPIRRESARGISSSAHGSRSLTMLASAPQIHGGPGVDSSRSRCTDRDHGRGRNSIGWLRAPRTVEEKFQCLGSERWPQAHASDWRTRGSLKRDGNGLLRTARRGKERHGRPTAQSVPKTGAQMPPGTCGRTSNELEVQREPKHSNWTEADATMRCLRGSWKRTKIQVIEHVQKSTLNSCPRPMRC